MVLREGALSHPLLSSATVLLSSRFTPPTATPSPPPSPIPSTSTTAPPPSSPPSPPFGSQPVPTFLVLSTIPGPVRVSGTTPGLLFAVVAARVTAVAAVRRVPLTNTFLFLSTTSGPVSGTTPAVAVTGVLAATVITIAAVRRVPAAVHRVTAAVRRVAAAHGVPAGLAVIATPPPGPPGTDRHPAIFRN